MDINDYIESPFEIKISFNKLLNQYDDLIAADNDFISANARRVLKIAEDNPILRDGFSDFELLKTYESEIEGILQDTFSPLLTNNEIKTASIPFHNFTFNSSERFKSVLKTAGDNYDLQIKNMPTDDKYIFACAIILNICYGYSLNFKRPFFYEIPDANGIIRYYKMLYNADFTEVIPKEHAPKITEEDYNELIDNFENIELWKAKFPPNSYLFKGFVISNIFDITDDQSISNIKSSLIGEEKRKDESFMKNFHSIFQSLLGLKDIQVGFSIYNKSEDTFQRVYGAGMKSYLLNDLETSQCSDVLCEWSYDRLLKEKKYFSISDIRREFEHPERNAPHIQVLHQQGLGSAIIAPIANEEGLMGILEIVSEKPKVLNSINANKLVDVMPFIVSAVERSKNEEENLIEAIIQKECTAIHASVHWKFVEEARNYINEKRNSNETPTFNKIAFDEVYPLYGQMDVKGSSDARNAATQKDLLLQLGYAEKILSSAIKEKELPIFEQIKYEISEFRLDLKENFKVDSEHAITVFLKDEVKPVFQLIYETQNALKESIEDYFNKVDTELDVIYFYRKHYDDTVKLINNNMSSLLDEKQVAAQKMYPHFFERFKTDGVEHNMYIGESITKQESFNLVYLYNLRLWQLQVMCEMENEYYSKQAEYPIALDVASMVLVFNQPLSIRFRMDEKRFDVDGTYNARYEVVKKRVDKAFVKDTKERITKKGKLTIVYSQKQDEEEYLKYIQFLQSKNVLDKDLEFLELEDLQAITGLKALRISILYKDKKDDKTFYTYNDLMETIKA
ncbi:GAF domain-containing protein [Winogradskyella bathintestinalis]|uniref:GAF domain-containing protein n=1 Tax=Winogradskyella bathintestinalis TaxID=3035208 RepID=A0ABT7ZQX6_9FLAO|nr:GAF domain-containing protein [Winogradskyella bathintestinalis]MDN3491214.1 GAF domain-containing protein [Winogradskyella bathintestinalis]